MNLQRFLTLYRYRVKNVRFLLKFSIYMRNEAWSLIIRTIKYLFDDFVIFARLMIASSNL